MGQYEFEDDEPYVVIEKQTGSVGAFLFGGGTTANLQARYAAVDLALPQRRGRQLSLIVWATTIGAVAGPNLTGAAGWVARTLGLPTLTGPFAVGTVGMLAAAVVIAVFLRPDPLLTARIGVAYVRGSLTDRSIMVATTVALSISFAVQTVLLAVTVLRIWSEPVGEVEADDASKV